MTDKIDSFSGEFEFLRNDYPSAIVVDGELYTSVEHAFQAAKTDDPTEKKSIREANTAEEAKRLGGKATLIADWDIRKVDIMSSLVQAKYASHIDLKIKLLMTGTTTLVAGNTRKDQFWGVTKDGVGENHIGLITMSARDNIRASEGTPQTVFCNFLRDKGLMFLNEDLDSVLKLARMVAVAEKLTVDDDDIGVDVEKTATFIKSFT